MIYRWVSPEYFRALDIPIVEGEGFSEEQLTSSGAFRDSEPPLASGCFRVKIRSVSVCNWTARARWSGSRPT